MCDFVEMKKSYPFSYLTIPPTVEPSIASITVIAVNKSLIEAVQGKQEDFTGEYSKRLLLIVPLGYRTEGCKVYGGKWIDTRLFQNKDIHFFHENGRLIQDERGLYMCVGTPDSFSNMKNVIFEAVTTAANMLVAYERVQSGASQELYLKAYSHGNQGKEEYLRDKKRYILK